MTKKKEIKEINIEKEIKIVKRNQYRRDIILPKRSFIAYKKAFWRRPNGTLDRCIIKLLIPANTAWRAGELWERIPNTSFFWFNKNPIGKCRSKKAKVLEITDMLGEKVNCAFSKSWCSANYFEGEFVYPDSFDESWAQCSHGIHFFLTEKEAREYYI